MSDSISSIRAQLWEKMRTKKYRDNFVAAHFSANIAAQIQTLREARGWTQKELGDKAEMAQTRISVMEDPSYDRYTFGTLKRLASAFDVAFIARFAPFSELATWSANLSSEKMQVPSFANDKLQAVVPHPIVVDAGLAQTLTGAGQTMSVTGYPNYPTEAVWAPAMIPTTTTFGVISYGTVILPDEQERRRA